MAGEYMATASVFRGLFTAVTEGFAQCIHAAVLRCACMNCFFFMPRSLRLRLQLLLRLLLLLWLPRRRSRFGVLPFPCFRVRCRSMYLLSERRSHEHTGCCVY